MEKVAQRLLVVSTLALLIEPLVGGWLGFGLATDQHVLSAAWPAHARFHLLEQAGARISVRAYPNNPRRGRDLTG